MQHPPATRRRITRSGLYLAIFNLLWSGYMPLTGLAADDRLIYSSQAPSWLRAVGKLTVPGSNYVKGRLRHHQEDCSATLVTTRTANSADTIVTAWHCLESYRDLSKPVVFTALAHTPQQIVRQAYRVADGGGMYADWAVLRLDRPIPSRLVNALPLYPGQADPINRIVMAGYSRDEGLGAGGTNLSFDPACRITGQQGRTSTTNCIAHKGASGGAVVQISASGKAMLCGVVSQGNGVGLSTFVPTETFRTRIR